VVQHLHEVRVVQQRVAIDDLTPREREVLTLLCEGLSTWQMAARLGVSGSTVQAHIKSCSPSSASTRQIEGGSGGVALRRRRSRSA